MRCKIHRLYRQGKVLSEEDRVLCFAIGNLKYAARLANHQIRLTVFTAHLVSLGDSQYAVPPLDCAVLTRIDERGMLLVGQEVIARSADRNARKEHYRQAWLVEPLGDVTTNVQRV